MFPATQRTCTRLAIAVGVAAYLVSGAASAHPGHHAEGFSSGLTHPFGGLDHLLAMVAVGLWAMQQGGRALYAVPGAFVAAMAGGFGLGLAGITLPFAETGILLSVLALGLAVALTLRPPLALAMLATAGFALCHGYAHALESGGAELAPYAVGMLLGTALLHGLGLIAARLANQGRLALLTRSAGAATAAIGLALLVQ